MMSEPDVEGHLKYIRKNWKEEGKNEDYWKGYKDALEAVLDCG